MKRFDESFQSTLDGADFDTIENSPHSIFALSPDLTFIYFNRAWFDFARENNGEPDISSRFALGTPIASGISGLLYDFYINSFKAVLKNMKVWHHEYECSGPTHYRLYQLNAYPLKTARVFSW